VSAATTGARIAAIVRPFGLNLVGIGSVSDYDALVPAAFRLGNQDPSAKSAIVLGHGGSAFWYSYQAHVAAHPEHVQRADPLDDFTVGLMRTAIVPRLRAIGLHGRVRFPFGTDEPRVSFVHLAEAAGLGCRSVLGVLIHPEFGPWIAFRGALLVADVLTAPRPAARFDPCGSCTTRPCIAVCPAAAVDRDGWNTRRCIDHRVGHTEDCQSQCDARVACVYGRAHIYPPAALDHHHRSVTNVASKRTPPAPD